MERYPMTYKDFEKRVSELFLDQADSPSDLKERKSFLRREVDVIKGEYAHACYYYDDPRSPSTQFTDERLLLQPVRILDMLY